MKNYQSLFLVLALISSMSALQLKSQSQMSQAVNLIVNGDFKINSVPAGEEYTFQTEVVGWITDDEVEVGSGNIYNSNWEEGTIIVELDGKDNDSISQIVKVTEDKLCKLSWRYAATFPRKSSCELRVDFNGAKIFQIDLSDDYQIHTKEIDVALVQGNNIFSFEAFNPELADGYGINITDVKLVCDGAIIQEEC